MEIGVQVYFIMLFAAIAASVINYVGLRRGRIVYLVAVFAALALLSGLRATSVGTDTLMYKTIFESIARQNTYFAALDSTTLNAPLYVFYNWVIGSLLHAGFQTVLFFNAAIISFCMAYLIYKLSDNAPYSVFCYIALAAYFQSMNAMRQYVAISLMAVGYYLLASKGAKSIRGWLLFFLALGVHTTSVAVLLPLAGTIYAQRSAYPKRALAIVCIVICLGALFAPAMVQVFVSLFPYYSTYVGTEKWDILRPDSAGRIILLYMLLAIPVVLSFIRSRDDSLKQNRFLTGYFPVAICALVFGLLYSQSPLMNRVVLYYLIAFVWLIPNTISACQKKERPLLYFVTTCGLSVWCILQLLANKSDVVPYVLFC